jgi:hypothetical protein
MTNPAPEPGPNRRDAKAEAKAAKAYAKAQRPWYKKKRFILPLALVALFVAVGIGSAGGSDDPTVTADPETVESAASALPEDEASEVVEEAEEEQPAAEEPAGKLPLQDGDWRLDQLRVEDDGLGDFGGTARITYTGDDPDGGTNIFTVTVFDKGGEFLGAMQGSAQEVKAGGTVSVQLISTDKYVKGPYTYDFQNDL